MAFLDKFKKSEGSLLGNIAKYLYPMNPHGRVHEGVMFVTGHYASAVANNASVSLLIVTGQQNEPHCVFDIEAGGDMEIRIFEHPTYVNPGTQLTPANKKRPSSAITASTLVYLNSSVTTVGDALNGGIFVPGGSGGNASGGVSAAQRDGEWILQPGGKSYLVRAFNRAGATKKMSSHVFFYEEAD